MLVHLVENAFDKAVVFFFGDFQGVFDRLDVKPFSFGSGRLDFGGEHDDKRGKSQNRIT